MKSQIIAFRQDPEGDWIADLSCGHSRHMRHKPPLAERPWVLTEAGRHARLGTSLDCVECQRKQTP